MVKKGFGFGMAVLMAAGLAARGGPPEGAEKNAGTFRGVNGSGFTSFANMPTEWSESDKKNILWKVAIELQAWGSPIVWGDRVIALGADQDNQEVYCFARDTGEKLWTRPVPKTDDDLGPYAPDTMDERWNALVHAGATPATDGKNVYVMFSNSQLAAIDLRKGEIVWNRSLGDYGWNLYGLDNSLLVCGKSLIVVFQGSEKFIAAYKVENGEPIWKTPRQGDTWASPILVRTKGGKDLVVLTADPDTTAWDAATGAPAWSLKLVTNSPEYCIGPSPVYAAAAGIVGVSSPKNGIYGIDPDKGEKVWGLEELPEDCPVADYASMTTDGNNFYHYFQSALTCLDARTGEIRKHKEMDESASYASPALNGDKLYLFSSGNTLIVNADPNGDFEIVGKGSIDDTSDASPALVEGRIFIRSDGALYAIGAK